MDNVIFVPGQFLSTLSLRRATTVHNTQINKLNDFYPCSPCGERPYYMQWDITDTAISIHALLAESDRTGKRAARKNIISIHALLAESDGTGLYDKPGGTIISIHALLAESDL